jgi:cell division protein ZapA
MTDLSIKIRISNREYPMRVKAEDESKIRQAGKKINEQIKAYQDEFGIDDKQDLLAMVTFDNVVEKFRTEEDNSAIDELAFEQIQRISNLISQSL